METQVKHIKLTVLLLEFGGKTVLICSCMTRHESDGCFSWSPMRRSCLLVLHTDTQRKDVVFQGRSSMISSLFVLTHCMCGRREEERTVYRSVRLSRRRRLNGTFYCLCFLSPRPLNCALRFLSHLRRQLNLKCNLVLNGLFRVVFMQEAKSEDVTMATDYSLLFPSLCFTDLTRSSYHHRQPGDQRTAGRLASRRGRQIRTRLYFYLFVVLFLPLYFIFSSVVFFFFPKILFLLSLSLLVFLTVHFRSFPLPFLFFALFLSCLVLIVFSVFFFSRRLSFSFLRPSLSFALCSFVPSFRPLHNIYVADTFIHSD